MYLCNYLERILKEPGAPKSDDTGVMTKAPTEQWLEDRKYDLNPEDVIVGIAKCVRCLEEEVDITIGTLFRWQGHVDNYNAKKGKKIRKLKVKPVCPVCRTSKAPRNVLKADTARRLLQAAGVSEKRIDETLKMEGVSL